MNCLLSLFYNHRLTKQPALAIAFDRNFDRSLAFSLSSIVRVYMPSTTYQEEWGMKKYFPIPLLTKRIDQVV